MLKDLIKLANHLDDKGFVKEADYVDFLVKKALTPDIITPEYGGPDTLGESYSESYIYEGASSINDLIESQLDMADELAVKNIGFSIYDLISMLDATPVTGVIEAANMIEDFENSVQDLTDYLNSNQNDAYILSEKIGIVLGSSLFLGLAIVGLFPVFGNAIRMGKNITKYMPKITQEYLGHMIRQSANILETCIAALSRIKSSTVKANRKSAFTEGLDNAKKLFEDYSFKLEQILSDHKGLAILTAIPYVVKASSSAFKISKYSGKRVYRWVNRAELEDAISKRSISYDSNKWSNSPSSARGLSRQDQDILVSSDLLEHPRVSSKLKEYKNMGPDDIGYNNMGLEYFVGSNGNLTSTGLNLNENLKDGLQDFNIDVSFDNGSMFYHMIDLESF